MALDPLTESEAAMLDLEAQWFTTSSAKEDAIRALGMSPVRYYQRLNRLLDSESALAYNAVVAHRLRRVAGHAGQSR